MNRNDDWSDAPTIVRALVNLQQGRDELLASLEWALFWVAPPELHQYKNRADYTEAKRKWKDCLDAACDARDRARELK